MTAQQRYTRIETSLNLLEQDNSSFLIGLGSHGGYVYVGLYVDYMIIAAKTRNKFNQVKEA